MARFTFATKPEHAGRVRLVVVGGVTHYVDYVPYGSPSDIVFKKWTAGYRSLNSRPYSTKRSNFGSLEAAVKSLVNA
jgi:hypothetical protein